MALEPEWRSLDLEIQTGQLNVLVGASKAGKSTLLNIIGGSDRPTSGEVWVDGENLAAMTHRQLTEYRRQKIGFVFQCYNLVPTLTVVKNVQASIQIASKPSLVICLSGLQQKRQNLMRQIQP